MKDQKYRNSNTKIVHIGMGKNGSTYLQKAVFPFLCKHYGLQYNPPEFDTLRRKRLSIPLNDLKDLKNLVRKNDILISSELLVGWNPRDWEEYAEKNLEIFGKDTTIVIFMRDPKAYLTSVYLQKISEGLVLMPNEFFVSSKYYESIKDFIPKIGLMKFDLGSFSYSRLEQIYRSRFDNVHILPIDLLKCDISWSKILGVNLRSERIDFFPNKTSNKSFSKLAVKLTFLRYYMFRFFGGRPISSIDFEYLIPRMFPVKRKKFNTLSNLEKFFELPTRVKLKILKPWKWWMQFVVDRALPYKKYTIDFDELPAKSCIDINQQFYDDLIEKVNRDVHKSSSNNDDI